MGCTEWFNNELLRLRIREWVQLEAGYAIIEPPFPLRDFTVSLHWSKRFEADPGNRWLRGVIEELFRE